MNIRVTMLLAALAALSGCATITGNEGQSLSVSALATDGTSVDKAECVLENDKGRWATATPNFVMVRRSAEDLTVICKKPGMVDGILKAVSRAAGSMYGNIIFGGGIGALIDHNKGTGYNYPDQLPVKMGSTVVVDRQDQDNAQRLAASGQSNTPQVAPGGQCPSASRGITC